MSVFEVLDGTFVLFGGFACVEGAEVFTLTGFRIELLRVEAIFAVGKFADHAGMGAN